MTLLRGFLFCLFGLVYVNAGSNKAPWKYTAEIREAVLKDYDPTSLPVENLEDRIEIKASFELLYLDVDEQESALVSTVWMGLKWKDARLRWDNIPKYNNVTGYITFHNDELWKPIIFPYNDASRRQEQNIKEVDLVVSNDGSTMWIYPVQYKTQCQLDFRSWPFDTQLCTVKMGVWTESDLVVDLKLDGQVNMNYFYPESQEWAIEFTSANATPQIYPCCKESYTSLYYNFLIKRSSSTLGAIIITPAVLITVLVISQFIVKENSVRLGLSVSSMFMIFLQLMYIGCRLPNIRESMPFIVMFYIHLLVATSVILLSQFANSRFIKTKKGDYM